MKKQVLFFLTLGVCFSFMAKVYAQTGTASSICKNDQMLFLDIWLGQTRGGIVHNSLSVKRDGQFELVNDSWIDDTKGTVAAKTVKGKLTPAELTRLSTLIKDSNFFQLPAMNDTKPSDKTKQWQQFIYCGSDGQSKMVQGNLSSNPKYGRLIQDVESLFRNHK